MPTPISISHEIILALSYTMAFGLMFLVSEIVYAKLKVDAELTRKFIHISCGSIALTVPIFRPHLYTILTLGVCFSILTYFMLRMKQLPSIHAVKRHSIGSVLYPLGIVMCVVFGLMDDYHLFFFLPLSNMIFSDTMAAIIGINYPIQKFKIGKFGKSIGGSTGFFVTAFCLFFICSGYFQPEAIVSEKITKGVLFATITTLVEMISVDGWDDLTVPASSFLVLYSLL